MNWWVSISLIILALCLLYYLVDDFSFDHTAYYRKECDGLCPHGGMLRYDDTGSKFFCVL